MQWYLSCKIQEWVAFGGERALEQGQFLSGIHRHKQFKREFYWDLWEDLEKHMKIQMQEINLSNALKKSSINIEGDAKVIGFTKPSIKLPKISIPKKSKKVSNNNKKILGPNSVFAFGNYLKGI